MDSIHGVERIGRRRSTGEGQLGQSEIWGSWKYGPMRRGLRRVLKKVKGKRGSRMGAVGRGQSGDAAPD